MKSLLESALNSKIKVAVIGAGFAGLGACYHLLSLGASVDLYEQKRVGGGASSASCGLLHPYAGEQVRRSYRATESLESTKHLLEVAQGFSSKSIASYSGILRKATPEQSTIFLKHAEEYQDVELVSDGLFLLKSGVLVRSQQYLEGLYKACKAMGLNSYLQKVENLESLKEYDSFVLALGAGVFSMPGVDCSKFSAIKGQSLVCRWPFAPLERPLLGKGHVAQTSDPSLIHLGATYERGILDQEAYPSKAISLLLPQGQVLFPEWKEIVPVECRAGIRVMYKGHAVPFTQKIGKGWIIAGMGSRGLLYHSYFSKKVAKAIVFGEDVFNEGSA